VQHTRSQFREGRKKKSEGGHNHGLDLAERGKTFTFPLPEKGRADSALKKIGKMPGPREKGSELDRFLMMGNLHINRTKGGHRQRGGSWEALETTEKKNTNTMVRSDENRLKHRPFYQSGRLMINERKVGSGKRRTINLTVAWGAARTQKRVVRV